MTQWYKEHNIAIYDQAGQLRNLYDILGDVANIWPTLTRNEQAYYLNEQAGANQTQNLAEELRSSKIGLIAGNSLETNKPQHKDEICLNVTAKNYMYWITSSQVPNRKRFNDYSKVLYNRSTACQIRWVKFP